jgi:hypothetical protein
MKRDDVVVIKVLISFQQSKGIVASKCLIDFPCPSSTIDVVKRFSIDLTSFERFLPMPEEGELESEL